MPHVTTFDRRFGSIGPGQQGDNLRERTKLVATINEELPYTLKYQQTFYAPVLVQYAHSTSKALFRRRYKQVHSMRPVWLYVLPARNGVHQFGISADDGTLFWERSLYTGQKPNVKIWFKVDDLYSTVLMNDVLSEYLLWSLNSRA